MKEELLTYLNIERSLTAKVWKIKNLENRKDGCKTYWIFLIFSRKGE